MVTHPPKPVHATPPFRNAEGRAAVNPAFRPAAYGVYVLPAKYQGLVKSPFSGKGIGPFMVLKL